MQNQPQSRVVLRPGEEISENLLDQLQKINLRYSKTKDFPEYERSIGQLFNLTSVQIKDTTVQFLAGFCEGEASMSVGIKKNKTSRFKLYLDPEFNITQHVNGVSNLFLAMRYFKTGRIRHKGGSSATLVYTIENRRSLKDKVLPFYDKLIHPFGSPVKVRRTQLFKKLLLLFEEKAHLDLERMINEVLPLWDDMRIQVNQSNASFKNLEEARTYVQKAAALSKKVIPSHFQPVLA